MKNHNILTFCAIICVVLSACNKVSPTLPSTDAPDTVTEEPSKPTPETATPETPLATATQASIETALTQTSEPVMSTSYDGFDIQGVGFETPESVLYDAEADVYLVANINGSPGAKDSNGFISRLSPNGEVLDLKWIDGAADGVTLNAPKGMALTSAGLYVADIDVVRLFDRSSGATLDEFAVEGASFLNDVAADEAGTVYVSGTNTGAIYMISSAGSVDSLIPAGRVPGPNGLAVWDGVVYTTSGDGVYAVQDGDLSRVFALPQGSLDGLVFLDRENILVSSWSAQAVYHATAGGDTVEVVSGVPAPADIGFDPVRGYILIPLFNGNAVVARLLP